MRLLKKMRKQWAVYWPPNGTDSHNKVLYGTPVELKVRWEDSTELFMNKAGQQQVSKAQVYFGPTTAADTPAAIELLEQGVLWLGPDNGRTEHPLEELDDAHKADPFKNKKAFTIQRIDILPDLKVKDFLRTAYL